MTDGSASLHAFLRELESERKAAIIKRHGLAAVDIAAEVFFALALACFGLVIFRLALQGLGVM